MTEQLTITAWREAFWQVILELWASVADLPPRLAVGLLIIVAAWVLAYITAFVARHVLRTVGMDRAAIRLAPPEVLEHAGIRAAPSRVLSKLLFWVVFLVFMLSSLDTLGLPSITAAVDRMLAYLPNLIGAALIVLLGLLLSRFLASIVSAAAAAGGFAKAPRFGFLAQILVGGVVVVTAVQQLGLAAEVLVAPLTAVLATAGLAGGLAFALGARPIITHILAGHFLRESLPRDTFIEINGERGVVERIGSTDTLLRSDEKTWSVPNARLLEEVVVR